MCVNGVVSESEGKFYLEGCCRLQVQPGGETEVQCDVFSSLRPLLSLVNMITENDLMNSSVFQKKPNAWPGTLQNEEFGRLMVLFTFGYNLQLPAFCLNSGPTSVSWWYL